MKRIWYLLALLIISGTSGLRAQETASQRAITEGFAEVKTFSNVLLPLCHQSLAKRDYATLISSGMDLKKAAWNYSKMKYMTHNSVKDSAYKACRDSLSLLAIAYAAAAERYDTNTVCAILPQMEQQFEGTAAAIVAYRWPEFEKVSATTEAFYNELVSGEANLSSDGDKQAKRKRLDPVATTDEIGVELAAWVASAIPKTVEYRSALIADEQKYYTSLTEKMKASAASGDRAKLRLQTTDLKVRLRNFTRSYLQ